jgi:hypothetical protein
MKLAITILAALMPALAADTITLRDGSRHYGTFVGSSGRAITFDENNGSRRTYNTNQVQSIEFDAIGAEQSSRRGGTFADRPNSRYADVSRRTLPAGTELVVRTNQNIEADSAMPGRVFSATVDRDVTDSANEVLIPRGSEAQLVVNDISSGGVAGSREMALDLQSVTVGGNNYFVSTEDVQQSGGRQGVGANRRTAEMVGGGAVLGTLLGAIAGGGKGAAIGAAAGAAAGAGVQVLTRGKTVRVPAETVLTFRLDQPVTLQRR